MACIEEGVQKPSILVSSFWRAGASRGPRTRERRLPAGDSETGRTAEESSEAPGRLRAEEQRGERSEGPGVDREA